MARTPTYRPHLRIQVAGDLGPSGNSWEIFSYGVSIGSPNGVTPGGTTELSDLVDDMLNFHGDTNSGICALARVTSVKVARVLPDGKWEGGKAAYERKGLDRPGGGPNSQYLIHAPQVAHCVTLRSAVNTPRTRGRFFLPLPKWSIQQADALISTADAQTVATAVATLVSNLNNKPGIGSEGYGVCVASTFGTNSMVTNISAGRALDTIRTRRNNLQEAYVSAPVSQ
jgi:hypothetical protein